MTRDGWRLAVGTLTAFPVKHPQRVDRQVAGVAMLLSPIAALPLALLIAAVIAGAALLSLPPVVASLLGIGAVVLGNRAFHLDGLSDVADGFSASYDRERSLAVMKSGTSGPAGVAAMGFVVAIQVAALAALVGDERLEWWAAPLLAGVAVMASRAALVLCCTRGVKPARADGLGKTFTETVPVWATALVFVTLAAVLAGVAAGAGLEWWRPVIGVVAMAAVIGVVLRRAATRFGGVTGDVFGACVEGSLAVLLVALV